MDEPLDELRRRQLELETDAVAGSVQRIWKGREGSTLAKTPAGAAILKETFFPLAGAIRRAQEEVEKGLDRAPYGTALLSLAPEKLAVITMNAIQSSIVLSKLEAEVPLTRLARDIGYWCWVECQYDTLRGREKNLFDALMKRNRNPWQAIRRAREKIEAFKKQDWAATQLDIKLGAVLLELTIRHTGLITERLRSRYPAMIQLTPEGVQKIQDLQGVEDCLAWPLFRPMIAPPVPWEGAEGGGLQSLSLRLVKDRRHPGTLERVKKADIGSVCRAVNALQETAWRINGKILDIAERVWERKKPKEVLWKLVTSPSLEVDSEDDEEETEVEEGHGMQSVRRALAMPMRLSIARRYLGAPAVYFPYQLDHRGRAYSIPQILQPQGDDLSRALLGFAEGKALGVRGPYWLAVHLANCFGLSRLCFEERVAWVNDHKEEIMDSATRPLEGTRYWTKADKPWRFLAAAMEWAGYMAEGPAYLSRIPVAMDGTCNGLQHLSAMGRDAEGGFWTNLVPGPMPQDIYQQVADRLQRKVQDLADEGHTLAEQWLGAIDRALVKPSTMTTPYGVTDVGIRGQVHCAILEHHPNRFDKPREAASFLAPLLKESIGDIVVKAAEITEWLRKLVRVFAKKGRGLSWVAPSGFPVSQERRRLAVQRVRTVRHALLLYRQEKNAKIDLQKQKDGIVPNLVHSLDAAHMMMTASGLKWKGVSSLAMVHDSYAVHADNVDLMNRVLRESFILVHLDFGLGDLIWTAEKGLPGPEYPRPPRVGKLDIEEVEKSAYFFS